MKARLPYAKGDRVRHPTKPEWGVGEVLEASSQTMVRVYFAGAGEKRLSLDYVDLERATGAKPKDSGLDKGVKRARELSDYCIYTIVSGKVLRDCFKRQRPATFKEQKPWATAYELWQKATANKRQLPVVFADAAKCSRLLYWAILTKVHVNGSATAYTIDRLRKVPGKHVPQDLILRSSRVNIAPDFIRPYAICLAPPFLDSVWDDVLKHPLRRTRRKRLVAGTRTVGSHKGMPR